ncbi:hypothetical protein TNCV_654681 [Trichonephila clavipes]|nr:hypothetical protein TNCV_654681 [Trichonephila clavipes]
MDCIYTTFTPDRVVRSGQFAPSPSWPLRSPDLSVSDHFLWGTFKSKVYRNNPHSLQKQPQNFSDEMLVISLRYAFPNLLKRAQEMNGGAKQGDVLRRGSTVPWSQWRGG